MATKKNKKKLKVKAKPKTKVTRAKSPKKKPAPARKKKKAPVFEETSTQQLAFAQIIGDIEERMALDRLDETR